MNNINPLAARAAALVGDRPLGDAPLHGGDLAEVRRVRLGSGGSVVAKSGPFPNREGRMLEAMARAGAAVPGVLASDEKVLVLQDLGPSAPATPALWTALGETLRRLHDSTAERYGWDEDYAFGRVAIANARTGDWPEFWFRNRIVAGIEGLPPDLARRLESLEFSLRKIVPARPAASLLHGDLWAGNVHFTQQGPYLIDPACYHGDGEVDLAMLTLFGSPPPAFREAYGPLDPGWETRRALYQLWPALVHLRLFGAGYRGMVEGLLTRLGG